MTEIILIFRFNISELVSNPVEELIVSTEKINIISGDSVRNIFLKTNNEIAIKINSCIDNGELIPTELWCPFWTAMIIESQVNVFTSLIGNLKQFKEFETCIKTQKFLIKKIYFLKVHDMIELAQLGKEKYNKVYDDTEDTIKRINEYQIMKQEIIEYAQDKYEITIQDYFDTEITV